MLTGVEIENFRGLGKLDLEGLGRVNLVVGKNNTGKTSLLEAITLAASPTAEQMAALPGLFRAKAEKADERFFRWLVRDGAARASFQTRADGIATHRALTRNDSHRSATEPADQHVADTGGLRLWSSHPRHVLAVHAVSVQHGGPESIVDAFAEAVRAPADERQMESLLASVDPRIKSVRLDAVQSKPFIVVDVGLADRVPLSQTGQGIYRLVAIFSELLGKKPNVCFIDELEDGIHYSALPSVWRGLAEVAARLDIQVFATTHSWECLVAAHEAFAARDPYDFRVIQLYRVGDTTEGRVLDRAHIEAAISGEIELR